MSDNPVSDAQPTAQSSARSSAQSPKVPRFNHVLPNPRLKRRVVMAGSALVLALSGVVAFGIAPNTPTHLAEPAVVRESLPQPAAHVLQPEAILHAREARIERGDTVAGILAEMNIHDSEVLAFLNSSPETDVIFRQLAPGRTVSAQVKADGSLASLHFPLSGERPTQLHVERTGEGFGAVIQALGQDTKIQMRSAEIRHSLFGAADEAGIPEGVAIGLAEIFAGQIDFHRDMRRGDRFSVVYEVSFHQGRAIRTHRILAAEFVNDGRTHQAFWFEDENGGGGYYTADGHSLRKSFLRSPLEFSRITSGFTNARFHPVLGRMRAHRGIDYAAPVGTRVRTTGDGVVEFAGVQGGYGKVIIVRHAGNKTTLYAHLSGFAPGIRKGQRVSQGELIGFVGATGLVTGPHLHYEFRVAGVHQDPLTVVLPPANPLSQSRLAQFKEHAQAKMARIELIRDRRFVMLD